MRCAFPDAYSKDWLATLGCLRGEVACMKEIKMGLGKSQTEPIPISPLINTKALQIRFPFINETVQFFYPFLF